MRLLCLLLVPLFVCLFVCFVCFVCCLSSPGRAVGKGMLALLVRFVGWLAGCLVICLLVGLLVVGLLNGFCVDGYVDLCCWCGCLFV